MYQSRLGLFNDDRDSLNQSCFDGDQLQIFRNDGLTWSDESVQEE